MGGSSFYEESVRGKRAEEILEAASLIMEREQYLLTVAVIRSNSELIEALKDSSAQSQEMANKVLWLTVVIAVAGSLQVLATAWPYLSHWWKNPV